MSGAEADKMPRPRGRRELTIMPVIKQLSTGQSWLPDWMREVSAKVNFYQSGRLCVGGRVNQATTRMWSLMNQAATKIWGRDLQEPVSSLVLAMVGEASPDLSYRLVCLAGKGRGGWADEQYDYLYPWSILHKEGDGRSWAINNTSNLPGVE